MACDSHSYTELRASGQEKDGVTPLHYPVLCAWGSRNLVTTAIYKNQPDNGFYSFTFSAAISNLPRPVFAQKAHAFMVPNFYTTSLSRALKDWEGHDWAEETTSFLKNKAKTG